jgi:Leucine-rich repeat (LRR) protein
MEEYRIQFDNFITSVEINDKNSKYYYEFIENVEKYLKRGDKSMYISHLDDRIKKLIPPNIDELTLYYVKDETFTEYLPKKLKKLTIYESRFHILHSLPHTITDLYFEEVYINTIETFPESLEYFLLMYTEIYKLPNIFPRSLKSIYIYGRIYVETLPEFPESLEKIYLFSLENVKQFPKLPSNIKELDITGEHIENIDEILIDSLESLVLYCKGTNKIKRLPQNLRGLCLERCDIIKLPELPKTLKTLNIPYTEISELPEELPPELETLIIYDTKIKELPILPETLTEFFMCGLELESAYIYNDSTDDLKEYIKRVNILTETRISKKRIIQRTVCYKLELIEKAWHPDRICKWIEAGIDILNL